MAKQNKTENTVNIKLKDFEEKRKFLGIAAYGIHYRYNQDIKKQIEEEFGERAVFLYEYLFDIPFVRGSSRKENSGFAPFLKRIIDEQSFIPKFDNTYTKYSQVVFNPANFKSLTEFWQAGEENEGIGCSGSIVEDVEKYTVIGKHIFNKWKDPNYLKDKLKLNGETKPDNTEPYVFLKISKSIVYSNWKFKKEYLKEQYLLDLKKDCVNSEISLYGGLKEYLTVVYPLLSLEIEEINVSVISISTEKIFYGWVLIVYPADKNISFSSKKGIFQDPESVGESDTIKKLTKIINDLYIPVLAYFENYWSEKKVNDWIDEKIDNDGIAKDGRCKKLYDYIDNEKTIIYNNENLEYSRNTIEKSFYFLWKERKEFILNDLLKNIPAKNTPIKNSIIGNLLSNKSTLNQAKTIERIKDNLIFAKFLIASPGIVDTLNEIVTYRNSKEKERQYCPSFLVVGDAGSGKDKMSKLIQLFFPEYRFGERFNINMASLKPPYLSVPLMNGGEIDYHSGNEVIKVELNGIFRKIWNQFEEHEQLIEKDKSFIEEQEKSIEEQKKRNKNEDKKSKNIKKLTIREFMIKKGLMPVIILDELNSLDIDAQGALLRILENKTLQALGSINELEIDFLIIGIVNEAEDALTLEEPLKKIITDNVIFGGILGKVVYEHVRNLRRLREDLYYRLIREGKVNIPELSKRREDIPMLFYFFLKDELEEAEEKLLWIDLSFFNELMSNRFTWNGNFRELQSRTKRIVQFARYDYVENPENNGSQNYFRITVQHLEKSLPNKLESI